MRLARCPQCDRIIDLGKIDELPRDTVIGCGLKEGMYESCEECAEQHDDEGCEIIRDANHITKTTITDMMEETDDN